MTLAARQNILLQPFAPTHIEGALRLSSEAGWPHRAEDWALTLSVSKGVVALCDGQVVGTALCSVMGDVATLNMIIVDQRMRGHGLGRQLMEGAMAKAEGREMRLIATADGLPLYRKLGFETTGEILQFQGIARDVPADDSASVQVLERPDIAPLAAMDLAASGMERASLLAQIAASGLVLGAAGGFALRRRFGRGLLLGPVVASSLDTAQALIRAGVAQSAGQFLRLDLPAPQDAAARAALIARMAGFGLEHCGGGTAMARGAQPRRTTDYQTFALVSQALG